MDLPEDEPVAATQQLSIIAFDGVQPLDVVGPHEVFAGANEVLDAEAYAVEVQASTPGAVRSERGLTLYAGPLSPTPVDIVIAAGGNGVFAACEDTALIGWITTQASTARRVASVCTGTFLLARAGLLDGHTVTTHWARAERLAREYQTLRVDADPIYISDGRIWTSAGVTAGLDLSLAIVAEDHGVDVAQTIARWLVMFRRRSGGQSQFAPAIWTRATDHQPVQAALDQIHDDPVADLSVEALARAVHLSPRHFSRVFTEHVGVSPGRYVDQVRVEAARHQLEQTAETVETIAHNCGFGTGETMRRTFARQLRVTPDQYRRHFSLNPSPNQETPS